MTVVFHSFAVFKLLILTFDKGLLVLKISLSSLFLLFYFYRPLILFHSQNF